MKQEPRLPKGPLSTTLLPALLPVSTFFSRTFSGLALRERV